VNIKISGKMMRWRFMCSKDYIINVCKGACCKYECPHKLENGLCKLHGTKDKPIGCIASPFFIKKGTLIIRQRYTVMKCCTHNKTGEYAYRVFRLSLDTIFGLKEAERICKLLDAGLDNIYAEAKDDICDELEYLESLKTKEITPNFAKQKRIRNAISVDKWIKQTPISLK